MSAAAGDTVQAAEAATHAGSASAAAPRPTLDEAVVAYRTSRFAYEEATANQALAHAAHVATMPLVGRVRLGKGSEATRKAHHAACVTVAATRAELHAARDELVTAALAHTGA